MEGSQEAVRFLLPPLSCGLKGEDEVAPVREKCPSRAPLSNGSRFKVLHLAEEYSLGGGREGTKKGSLPCTIHDSFHRLRWPFGARSLDKQRQTRPLLLLLPHRSPSWLITLQHRRKESEARPNVDEFTAIASSCCHRSLEPSLFNLSNLLLATAAVKRRLWGLLNRDPNRVSLFLVYGHDGWKTHSSAIWSGTQLTWC